MISYAESKMEVSKGKVSTTFDKVSRVGVWSGTLLNQPHVRDRPSHIFWPRRRFFYHLLDHSLTGEKVYCLYLTPTIVAYRC